MKLGEELDEKGHRTLILVRYLYTYLPTNPQIFLVTPGSISSNIMSNSLYTLFCAAAPFSLLTHLLGSRTKQSVMYFPWLSSPALAAVTNVLLPTSVVRPISLFPTQPRTLSGKTACLINSEWQKPGVKVFNITCGFPEAVMAGASSRIVRISRSLEVLYLSDWYVEDLRALKMCGADCSLNTA